MAVVSTSSGPAPEDAPQGLGLSEHDKAMIAKVDAAAGVDPAAAPTKPEGIPDKFWDAEKGVVRVEDLAKSYAELERARTGQPKADDKAPPAAEPAKVPEGAVDSVSADAEAAAKAAGADTSKVDFTALTQEFAEKGTLSEDSYKALQAAGMSKELVDQFIEGRQAVAQTQLAESYALAGGEAEYKLMAQWAATALPADEQAAFDRAVLADPGTRKMAITALKARYTEAVGSDPKLIKASTGGAEAGAFQSRAEVTQAMRDPRYQKDPAYRASVERRLANSSVF